MSSDGGYIESSGCASWAFTVIGRDGDGDYWFLGSVAGPVISDPRSAGWVGAEKASNNTGEVSAAIWAYAWLCSIKNAVPAIMHLDSTVAGSLCHATATSKTNRVLVDVAQSLHAVVGAQRCLTWHTSRRTAGTPGTSSVACCDQL
ncbi:hypothetical protein N9L68_05250 [bacterium]|nr:hypothetical protein [bacterium]